MNGVRQHVRRMSRVDKLSDVVQRSILKKYPYRQIPRNCELLNSTIFQRSFEELVELHHCGKESQHDRKELDPYKITLTMSF